MGDSRQGRCNAFSIFIERERGTHCLLPRPGWEILLQHSLVRRSAMYQIRIRSLNEKMQGIAASMYNFNLSGVKCTSVQLLRL